MIKFTYRSISGEDMPSEHNGDAKSLRKQFGEFGGSCTPISSIEGEPIDLSKFILGEMDAVHNQINELIEEKKRLSKELEERTKKIWEWKSKKKS
jgi:hypothetical protein